MPPFISIVIPAYNEEAIIEKTLEDVTGYLAEKRYDYEVLVVCDGCVDRTADIVKERSVRNARLKVIDRDVNRGKGFSVKEGCLEAEGEFIIFMDADLAVPLNELEGAVHWLQDGYDMVIGSRALKKDPLGDDGVRRRLHRQSMSSIFNLLVRTLVLKGFMDTQCGFKGFRKEAAKKIFSRLKIIDFGFDVEALYIAYRLNLRIKEFPVLCFNRAESKVNPIWDSLRMFCDLLRIRLFDLRGGYGAGRGRGG